MLPVAYLNRGRHLGYLATTNCMFKPPRWSRFFRPFIPSDPGGRENGPTPETPGSGPFELLMSNDFSHTARSLLRSTCLPACSHPQFARRSAAIRRCLQTVVASEVPTQHCRRHGSCCGRKAWARLGGNRSGGGEGHGGCEHFVPRGGKSARSYRCECGGFQRFRA